MRSSGKGSLERRRQTRRPFGGRRVAWSRRGRCGLAQRKGFVVPTQHERFLLVRLGQSFGKLSQRVRRLGGFHVDGLQSLLMSEHRLDKPPRFGLAVARLFQNLFHAAPRQRGTVFDIHGGHTCCWGLLGIELRSQIVLDIVAAAVLQVVHVVPDHIVFVGLHMVVKSTSRTQRRRKVNVSQRQLDVRVVRQLFLTGLTGSFATATAAQGGGGGGFERGQHTVGGVRAGVESAARTALALPGRRRRCHG